MEIFAFRGQWTLQTFPYWLVWILNHNTWVQDMTIFLWILTNNLLAEKYKKYPQSKIKPLNLQSHCIYPLKVTENFIKWVAVGLEKKLDKIINITLTIIEPW